MQTPRKFAATAAVALLAVTASTLALAQGPRGAGETLVVDNATVDWIEFSNVAALIEGNIESLELEIGKPVKKDGVIGHLYSKKAELAVNKAKTAASSVGAIKKAKAQKDQAETVVRRNIRLTKQNPTYVSKEDQDKALADLEVTMAMIEEAEENVHLAKDEMALAQNALDEHTIRAPFGGIIMKRIKNVGESVRANEPVVELGNLDKLRVFAFIPLEYSYRVAEGAVVEFQVKIEGNRSGRLPIEQKKFRGKISFVDPQVQGAKDTEVRIYADFPNDSHELKPGIKGTLTIYLGDGAAAPAGRVGQAAAVRPEPAPAVGGLELPQLPR